MCAGGTGGEELGEALTHLRCVLIPGGLGFTATQRKIVSIDSSNVSVKCEK